MKLAMKLTRHQHAKRLRGFTITELLIGMTLGLVLISGMLSVFIGSKRTSDLNTALADLQENARYIIESMSREIRLAGFQGCVPVNENSTSIRTNDAPTGDFLQTLIGGSLVVTADNWTPAPPPTFIIPNGLVTAVPGTHTLSVQFGSIGNSTVNGPMESGGSQSLAGAIPVSDNDANLKSGDFAIISDCNTADLFRVGAAPQGAGVVTHPAGSNVDANLSKVYGEEDHIPNTRLMKFHSNVYFVGTRGDSTADEDPIRSLYLQTLPYTADNPPIELVEGVENFRVRFGIRQNNGSIVYVTANDPRYDATRVQSVQLGILMVSYDRIRSTADEQTYVLAGQEIQANGQSANGNSHSGNNQYRLVFNTTAQLRNRRGGGT